MKTKELPNTIFLQIHEYNESVGDHDEISFDDVTWSEDRIYPTDVEYTKVKSPWISVEERLPCADELVLCQMGSNYAIVSGYIFINEAGNPQVATDPSFEFEDYNDYKPVKWMSIPPY